MRHRDMTLAAVSVRGKRREGEVAAEAEVEAEVVRGAFCYRRGIG